MKLVVLDPGHFHAALLQKTMYPDVDATVHVYAEEGPDLADYLQKIEATTRGRGADGLANASSMPAPISWNDSARTGRRRRGHRGQQPAQGRIHDPRDRRRHARARRQADGDRRRGLRIVAQSVRRRASEGRAALRHHDRTARDHHDAAEGVLAHSRACSASCCEGSEREPAVVKESVHHFSKQVSGAPVKRPAWFFDVAQQGEGLVDITTHLVDLVQWECFPGEILDFARDVRILGAKRWPTVISPAQFAQVTQLTGYPEFLRKDVQADGSLHVYANGEIDYRIRGVHAKVCVLWKFEAPAGAGDTHFSVHARLESEPRDPPGRGRSVSAGPVHRASRECGPAEFASALEQAVRRRARDVSRRRREARRRHLAGHRSGVLSCRPRGAFRAGRRRVPRLRRAKRALPDWEVPP